MRCAGQSCAHSQHVHPGTPGGELEVGELMKERQRGKSANEERNARAQAEQRERMASFKPSKFRGKNKEAGKTARAGGGKEGMGSILLCPFSSFSFSDSFTFLSVLLCWLFCPSLSFFPVISLKTGKNYQLHRR